MSFLTDEQIEEADELFGQGPDFLDTQELLAALRARPTANDNNVNALMDKIVPQLGTSRAIALNTVQNIFLELASADPLMAALVYKITGARLLQILEEKQQAKRNSLN